MIQGEFGPAVLDQLVALQLEGLFDSDSLGVTLLAACFADALRKGETPRQIAEGLFTSLPSDEAWDAGMMVKVREAIELREEQQAA